MDVNRPLDGDFFDIALKIVTHSLAFQIPVSLKGSDLIMNLK
jgi:hypothetical protein